MKKTIDVKDRNEGNAIARALDDPTMRATVTTIGYLLPLSPKDRQRVLTFVADKLSDEPEG